MAIYYLVTPAFCDETSSVLFFVTAKTESFSDTHGFLSGAKPFYLSVAWTQRGNARSINDHRGPGQPI